MRRVSSACAVATLAIVVGYSGGLFGQTADGFTVLFDGKSLAGWQQVGNANWQIVDGVAQADSGSGFLVSQASYGNFHLKLEFWVDPDANSGVFLRCSDANQVTDRNSYEVNIYDKRPDPTYRTGGVVHFAAPASTIDAGNRWNTYEIVANGPKIQVTLNGTVTVNMEDGTFARGPFALQYGAGTVKFRNVQIKPL